MPRDKERMKRGLDAIFEGNAAEGSSEFGVLSSEDQSKMPDHPTVDKNLMRELIGEVGNNGRVSFWSIQVALMMAYLGATIPARKFSVSNEIREILEPGLKEKYPELYEAVKKELGSSV